MEPQGNTENILRFKGFRSPRYTQVPDEIFDELMRVLSGAEIKVLLYICRRTFGFKKDSDAISLSQISNGIKTKDGRVLDRGTGLSKAAVARATKRLEDLGVIVRGRMRSKGRGDEPTTYSLNIVPVSENRTHNIQLNNIQIITLTLTRKGREESARKSQRPTSTGCPTSTSHLNRQTTSPARFWLRLAMMTQRHFTALRPQKSLKALSVKSSPNSSRGVLALRQRCLPAS